MAVLSKLISQFPLDPIRHGFKALNSSVQKLLIFNGVVFGFLVCRIFYKKLVGKINKSPPQLYGLPLFGSFLTFLIWKNNFSIYLLPKYGDLVTYNIFNIKYYKINNINLAKKILDFSINRPNLLISPFKHANVSPFIAAINNNNKWKIRRKLMLNYLTNILNKSIIEDNISKILKNITYQYLDNKIIGNSDNNKECLWYPRECCRNISFNTIYLSIFNKILPLDGDKFKTFNVCIVL